ncbi:MAG: ABC transporter permease [Deltaproteobacteria bacterium]|nr:ABC transporter permease [Deltaproteobacteria bacterium]
MNTIRWVAWRVMKEILRDRRTVAFFFLIPVIVMSLVYLVLAHDETVRVAVVARGLARLYTYDLERTLENEKDVTLALLDIPDEERDPARLTELIRQALEKGEADGVLFFDEALLNERFNGEQGTMRLFLEGSRPTRTALVGSAVASAADDLAASLPVVIDQNCSAECANSVNVKPLNIEKEYLHGSDDLRTIDFFLPVLVPFFVFFLTFIISDITFQRERARGTLDRLLIAPVGLGQIVLGYIAGFFIFALMQASVVMGYLLALLGFPVSAAQVAQLALIMLLMMLVALLLGLVVSFAARNEFQAIQFVPLVILPQVFFSDLIWSIETFPDWLRWFAYVLPLTHANMATRGVLLRGDPLWMYWPNLAALAAMFIFCLGALALVGKRRGA